ncbi:MAG: hypothetical protein PVJ86_12230, partial [Phycisphaerales bacterium]
MKKAKLLILGTLAACLVMVAATPAGAIEYDMTTDPTGSPSVTINGAIWEILQVADPTGSGVFSAFFRVKANGTEQGYNTDGRPLQFDELKSKTFTHSFRLEDVPIIDIGGIPYREFQLDINENTGGTSYYMSLNEFQVWTTNDPNILGYDDTTNSFPIGSGDGEAQLAYNFNGGDDSIKMDYRINPGSGKRDYRVYVPVSYFIELEYVVIFTRHGDTWPTDDGFEEWGVAVYPTAPNTMVQIATSAPADVVIAGETVDLTVTETNAGTAPLTNV